MKTFLNQGSKVNRVLLCFVFTQLFAVCNSKLIYAQNPNNLLPGAFEWTLEDDSQGNHGVDLVLKPSISIPAGSNVTGFDIYFYLDQDFKLPETEDLQTQNSWLISDPGSELSLEVYPAKHKFRVKAQVSSGKEGNGEFLRIRLNTLDPESNKYHAVIQDGGIIMIEDIGFRMQEPDKHEPAIAFPNPCQDQLQIDWGSNPVHTAILYNSSGKEVQTIIPVVGEYTELDVRDLPQGIYHLVFRHHDGTTKSQKIRID